jgi:FkbM family methyltransferase
MTSEPLEILPTRGRAILNVIKSLALASQRRLGSGLGLWRVVDAGTKVCSNWQACPVVGPDREPFSIDLRGRGFGLVTQGFATGEIMPLIAQLDEDAVVLDVGANIGVWTRLFARRVRRGKVYAFEPSPSTFALLRSNCAAHANVECVQRALGAQSGSMGFVEDTQPELRHLTAADGGGARVSVSRLDDWLLEAQLTRLDLLKIDVEGFEEELLEGACETLRRFQPLVLFEFIPHMAEQRSRFRGKTLFRTLRALGYRTFRLDKAGALHEDFVIPEDWTNDYAAFPAHPRFDGLLAQLAKR